MDPLLSEEARLRSLASFDILDSPPEEEYQDLVETAAEVCEAPIALISLVDAHRQWFKARVGLPLLQTPRDVSFCARAITHAEDLFLVRDAAADPRFRDNPLVTGEPFIRFYAGVPLVSPEGARLGTLCVIDRVPRELTPVQQRVLRTLARHVVGHLERRRTLHALVERERELADLLSLIVEKTGDGVVICDEQGVIQLLNGAAQQQHGVGALHVKAHEWARAFGLLTLDGQPLPLEQTPLYRALQGERVERASWQVRRPDGTLRTLSGSAAFLRHRDGQPAGAVLVTRDETDHLAEDARRERAARQAALRADVSAALSRGGTLRQMLQECTAALVRHLDAAFARVWVLEPATDTLVLEASTGRSTPPDGAYGRIPVGQFKVGRIAAERRPHLTNDVLHDPLIHDKAWAAREGMVAFAGYPLLVEGQLVGVVGVFARHPLGDWALEALANVADGIAQGVRRKRAEEALQEREERLQRLLTSIEEGIYGVDTEGRVTFANPACARLLGYPGVDSLLGREMHALAHHTRPGGVPYPPGDCPIHHAAREGRGAVAEDELLWRADGTAFPAELRAHPMRTGDRLVGAVVVAQDITARKRAEEEARRAAELREQFTGILGHDLRNPLSVISLSASTLLRAEELTPVHRRAAERIASNAGRMTRMIRDLLDFTRTRQGGDIPIHPQPTDARALFHQVLEELQAAHPGRTLHVTSEGNGQGEWDPDRLAQVLWNLLENAVRYSPEGTPVHARLTCAEALTLQVHNQGPPIPPEALPTLFEPFRRASNASPGSTSGGLGLGLFIVERIVHAHGGRVEVTSSAEAGTTFTVHLPRVAPQPGAAPG